MLKKNFIVIASILILAAVKLMAREAVLIDFNTLKADYTPNSVGSTSCTPDPAQATSFKLSDPLVLSGDTTGTPSPGLVCTDNKATTMDFSNFSGASNALSKLNLRTSLAIRNWIVTLSSSSRFVDNAHLSYTAPVEVSGASSPYDGKTVLGARIHFPVAGYNGYAIIAPPFTIPTNDKREQTTQLDGTLTADTTNNASTVSFDKDLSRFEGKYEGNHKLAYGIVKNVGSIKSIAINVRGDYYKHGISLLYHDEMGVQHEVFMGYLDFAGWKTLIWNNPQYVSEVRNRTLVTKPTYPRDKPFVALDGFRITRTGDMTGGDFIVYIADVSLIYDQAFPEADPESPEIPTSDIPKNGDGVWHILTDREANSQKDSSVKYGTQQMLDTDQLHSLARESDFTARKLKESSAANAPATTTPPANGTAAPPANGTAPATPAAGNGG